jgi:hypothetical protein
MPKQENNTNDEKDLSLPKLMAMPYEDLDRTILTKSENLQKIANDERHVLVLNFRMLRENNDAIKKFNRSSTSLSCATLILVVIQIFLTLR